VTAHPEAEITSLQHSLALAKRIGAATSYADLVRMAAEAYDDGAILSITLFVYDYDEQGLPEYARIVAGWRRGLDHYPAVGQRFAMSLMPLSSQALQSLVVVPNLETERQIDESTRAILRQAGTGAFLSVPMVLDKLVIGSILASWPAPTVFDRAMLQIGETLMALAPGVAERVHLYEESRRQVAALETMRAMLAVQVEERTVELRQRADELIESNQRLEQSFSTSPLATLEADDQGVIRRWNPAAEQIFGWSAAEAIGRNAVELLVPGIAREQVAQVVGALLSGEATDSRNVNLRKDGKLITCQWNNAVLHDTNGKILGWLSQTQDITDQLAAEAEQRQNTAFMQAIFNAMNDFVLVIDAEGTYLNVAPTQPELRHGYASQLLGKRIADIFTPAEVPAHMELLRTVLASGEPGQHDYTFPTANGGVHFSATVSRLSPQTVLWVARDVTQQLQAEEERLVLQEQIIEAQQAALRELSTPIIPISDGVIAMPLIGSIDSNRAQGVLEGLLTGVAELGASVAILDITGVPVVDTQVANALLRAAQAVKLLGAQVIITGIRPEVAQTLVGLGLDLSGIITLATLQSGVAWALARREAGRR
jgi:rsbT co-antagonist protein RsbR